MIKKLILISFSCFILASPQISTVFADSMESQSTKTLTIEETVQLALANYANIKLSQWNVATSDAQYSYVNAEQKNLEQKNVAITSGTLPVSTEYFMKNIPNYNQLSDEEKAGLNQSIAIQIMINASLNQQISAQTDSQNIYNQQQKTSQLKEFSDKLRSLNTDKVLARLELQKSEALIRYYAIQKYAQLSSQKANIEFDKQENQYWITQADDALILFRHGVLSRKSLEDATNKVRQQKAILERDQNIYKSQMDMFKLELGLSSYKDITLAEAKTEYPKTEALSTIVDMDNNFDLKEEDAKIALAKSNYDAVTASNSELKSYYSVIWSSQIGHKNIVQQQLEEKWAGYKSEAKEFYTKYLHLEEDYIQLIQSLEDSKTLYGKGLITLSEIDKNQLQLIQLNREMNNLKFDYFTFLEKVNLAVKGVIL
ncbi:hypothetical protein [Paenibacillus wynnii]|uniref:Copper amine oxidase-like N-terminal domain-containing protein n=1 Tax=Paenibacillus wynnii TaxID=268407 RepID=A0A098MEI7_9BACL|nr:hypothetical protein [Paenibacillus wynnii]KGE20458.1 hypothetical protein PWYN_14750 [Paenibacillus wynnii]